jgi:hypothetical protein
LKLDSYSPKPVREDGQTHAIKPEVLIATTTLTLKTPWTNDSNQRREKELQHQSNCKRMDQPMEQQIRQVNTGSVAPILEIGRHNQQR